MKAVQVISPKQLVIAEQPIPLLEDGSDLVIRVKAAGICGSDMSIYAGTSPVATYPRVIGHEFAGEVVAVGDQVSTIQLGDHVVVNPVVNCGSCRVCQKGRGNVCANLQVIGVHLDGGFQEYVRVPAENAYIVPKDLPWEQAAIVEPYAVASQVADRGGVQAGDTVLILGCGQIALMILQVCKLLGARCIMTDVMLSRRNRALEYGADFVIDAEEDVPRLVMALTEGVGADVAIDAACVGETLRQGILCTRPAGVVVTMGFADRQVAVSELQITKNELDIRGSRLNNHKFAQVISWVTEGKLNPASMITHRFPMEQVLDGMAQVKEHPEDTMKVVLTFA